MRTTDPLEAIAKRQTQVTRRQGGETGFRALLPVHRKMEERVGRVPVHLSETGLLDPDPSSRGFGDGFVSQFSVVGRVISCDKTACYRPFPGRVRCLRGSRCQSLLLCSRTQLLLHTHVMPVGRWIFAVEIDGKHIVMLHRLSGTWPGPSSVAGWSITTQPRHHARQAAGHARQGLKSSVCSTIPDFQRVSSAGRGERARNHA